MQKEIYVCTFREEILETRKQEELRDRNLKLFEIRM
jgi:hypothetical protein